MDFHNRDRSGWCRGQTGPVVCYPRPLSHHLALLPKALACREASGGSDVINLQYVSGPGGILGSPDTRRGAAHTQRQEGGRTLGSQEWACTVSPQSSTCCDKGPQAQRANWLSCPPAPCGLRVEALRSAGPPHQWGRPPPPAPCCPLKVPTHPPVTGFSRLHVCWDKLL